MAQEVINVGTTPGDGTGDAGRNAFIKCNDNFTELYSAPTLSGIISALGFNATGAVIPANGIYEPSAGVLGFAAGSAEWGTVNATGNWALLRPSSGVALTINAVDATIGLQVDALTDTRVAISTSGTVYGQLQSVPGSNVLRLAAVGAATTFVLQTNAVDRLTVSPAGNATWGAPSSGDTATFSGLGGGSMSVRAQSSADGVMAFIGRAGATNNPRLQVSTTEASALTDLNFTGSAGTPNGTISVNGVTAVTLANGRNVTISAPASGVAMVVNNFAGAAGLLVGAAAVSSVATPLVQALAAGTVFLSTKNTSASIEAGLGDNGTLGFVGTLTNQSFAVRTNNTARATWDTSGNVINVGAVTSSSASGGVGYSTGAGSTVTQATNRSTGVTINAVTGSITLASAAGTTAYASFTVTNSAVAATDVIKVVQKSGTDLYIILVTAVAAGSFRISAATTGGTTTEQPVFNFVVIKGVTA